MEKILKKVMNGEIVLYERNRSKRIQARIKLASTGKWVRVSCKTSDIADAEKFAVDYYNEDKFKKKYGITSVSDESKSFRRIATETNRRLNLEMKYHEGKKTYKDYIRVIKQYLIPFFGDTPIDKIDYKRLLAFDKWRVEHENFKRVPAKSTISTHNAAMNQVFQTAIQKGIIETWQKPQLHNKGVKTEVRPYFTMDEFTSLHQFMIKWCETGHSNRTKMLRRLLKWYVLILANTGMRPGTEADNLKWNMIEEISSPYEGDKRKYIRIWVNGKTGRRELIARQPVKLYLLKISENFVDLRNLTLDKLFQVDEYVFRLEDGTRPYQFAHSFDQLLRDSGLEKDKHGNKRSLYSIRHTYATYQILNGMDLHSLARQMGTSQKMLENTYSHLKPYMKAREFAGIPKEIKLSTVDILGKMAGKQEN